LARARFGYVSVIRVYYRPGDVHLSARLEEV
jgi:hypothetical protein